MKWFILIIALAMFSPSPSWAANGASCEITPPSTVGVIATPRGVADSCTDVCDYAGAPAIDGALSCGPIWIPNQNSVSTSFHIIASSANCTFDNVDVVHWHTATAPSSQHMVVLGTLDDDSGCGIRGTTPCLGVHVPYPIAGYIFVTSGAVGVGGASCTSFKIRMMQGAPR